MPAEVPPAVPGGTSVPAPLAVGGPELEVDPLEPAGVPEEAAPGLPSGVAVTVVGAPAADGRFAV